MSYSLVNIIKNQKLSLSNLDMLEKFVKPSVWEGVLWVDGGWGPKNEIQDLMAGDPVIGFILPFFVNPTNDIDDSGKSVNQAYSITFPGEQYTILMHFIEAIKKLGVKEQRYILNSYFSTKIPDEGKEIYQLCITVTQEETTITIEKGNWIPSFENSIPIAGWYE